MYKVIMYDDMGDGLMLIYRGTYEECVAFVNGLGEDADLCMIRKNEIPIDTI